MSDMCDCDDCGGVTNCGCDDKPVVPAGASCSGGVCSVTSQSTGASRMRHTPIHQSSARLYRGTGYQQQQGTKLSAYEELSMKVGPQVTLNGPMDIVPVSGMGLPSDLNVPYPKYDPGPKHGMIPAAGQAKTPQGVAPQGGSQDQGGMPPELAQGLLNLGQTGLGALQTIITTAITQGNTTERARLEADMRREVARLQARGLLTSQQAADALGALQNAQASAPPPPPPPPPPTGWNALSTPAKVGIIGGGVVGLAGLGYLVYRATRQ